LTDLNIIYNAAINRLIGEADQLEQVEYITAGTSKMTIISAQTLIFATGRFPELVFVRPQPEGAEAGENEGVESLPDESLRWEAAPPYKQPALKDEVGLFAEGDVLADYSAAIKAIGAGRRAAASIHQIMHGLSPSLTEHVITPQSTLQNVYHVEKVAASQRQIMPICSGQELAACGEIEKGFSAGMAKQEADRCLQCGLICYAYTEPDGTDEAAASAEAST
jgi:NADPH-dependent glutamate synthase beta subunit-like oxidoreductase